MIKNFKIFEAIEQKYKSVPAPTPENYPHWIFPEIDDNVVYTLTGNRFLTYEKVYKVINIYTGWLQFNSNTNDKIELLMDIEDLETGEITKGWRTTDFVPEIKYYAYKYNL